MADTLQNVSWILEQSCPFRQGTAATSLEEASKATWWLQAIDGAAQQNDRYGDICVIGATYFRGEQWPSRGFRITEPFAPVGSEDAARRLCRNCPANALHPTPEEMAGCTGGFWLRPDDPDLERNLRAIITAKSLASEYEQAFLPTSPLWYGLWATSPLQPRQMRLLLKILPQPSGHGISDTSTFRRACQIALERGLTLQVWLAPPGHSEDQLATYSHCPRCKKETPRNFLKRSATTGTCPTCRLTYSPSETTYTQINHNPDELNLERLLSPEEFRALRKEWEGRHPPESLPIVPQQQPWLNHLWKLIKGRFGH